MADTPSTGRVLKNLIQMYSQSFVPKSFLETLQPTDFHKTSSGYYYVKDGQFSYIKLYVIGSIIGTFIAVYATLKLSNPYTWTDANIKTWIFACFLSFYANIGTIAGVHRLWSHRAFQASFPVRVFLMLGHVLNSIQGSVYTWARKHRVHHKYADTDGDPHNAKRGFLFAHMGWVFYRKHHPELVTQLKKVNVQDLVNDPVVMFQYNHFVELFISFGFLFPIFVCCFFFEETLANSFFIVVFLRMYISTNGVLFINSAAHMYGDAPYDKNIDPRQNSWVSFGSVGEGYHNFHHTFPHDYASSEDGCKINPSKWFIELMAYMGLAWKLRRVPVHVIAARIEKNTQDKNNNILS